MVGVAGWKKVAIACGLLRELQAIASLLRD
jgi:hypothetical protein